MARPSLVHGTRYDSGPQTAATPAAAGPAEDERRQERMSAFVASLESEAKRRVMRRNSVENRWIEDLQQYHGVYPHDVEERMKRSESSRAFIALTATKTDAMVARLFDLLFPTDDKNWAIEPTPVPDLVKQAEAVLQQIREARKAGDMAQAAAEQAAAQGDQMAADEASIRVREAEQAESAAHTAASELHEIRAEARRRARMMSEEIDDQLTSCNYASEVRDVIEDACKLGCGVLKGPVLGERPKQRWRQAEAEEGSAPVFELQALDDNRPAAYRVDPWSFFPDPEARRIEDSEGFYERHLYNKQQMRRLADREEIDADALRDVLQAGPEGGATPAYMADLQNLTRQSDGDVRDAFQVWEYTGPIEPEDLALLQQEMGEATPGSDADADPLDVPHVRLMFCQGRVLSFAPHPLDSNAPLYSVFTLRRDESSLFGFGIPFIMRHPQAVLNHAFRMMMDNAALSTGPQVVVNKDAVEPEDGDWKLRPRKVWKRNSSQSLPGNPPFETFNIPANQEELAGIISLARAMVDEVTAMPAITEGEPGTGAEQTAQGMAILMNSANVTFRRIVRNFDDDITAPTIARFYDWNMQFNKKDAIKGDYEIKARGSGVLLVREMQAQNLMVIAQTFGDHPRYGKLIKDIEIMREIFRAHMIPADELTRSEEELEAKEAEDAQQVDPAVAAEQEKVALEREKLAAHRDSTQADVAKAEMESHTRLQIAGIQRETALITLAEKLNMDLEKLRGHLQVEHAKIQSGERKMAAEIAMAHETGEHAGGSV